MPNESKKILDDWLVTNQNKPFLNLNLKELSEKISVPKEKVKRYLQNKRSRSKSKNEKN